ncbi:MAG: septation protein SpoVG family protein [Candidatus Thorarchaeota archaeon]|jgi:DNA-binding cell septation regulator SpoVG
MSSKVTKVVRVRYKKVKSLRAFVDVEVNDDILIRDIKVIEGSEGEFISMPSREAIDKETKEKFYINMVQAVKDDDKEAPGPVFHKHLQDTVLEAYHDGQKGSGDDSGDEGI